MSILLEINFRCMRMLMLMSRPVELTKLIIYNCSAIIV